MWVTSVKAGALGRFQQLGFAAAMACVFWCSGLSQVAYGQVSPSTSGELEVALKRAKAGEADGRDIVVIADAAAIQAIPDLEKQFSKTTDVDTKVSLASGLVKLRDEDDRYWKYLLEQATAAVESDVPDSNFSQSEGKMMMINPELQAWASSHNMSVNEAFQSARLGIPGKIFKLATAGDRRCVPLLRRALQARNYLIVLWASKGLAEIQDKESIPLIISAVQSAPYGYNEIIAESLLYFDDARAEAVFDNYVQKDRAKIDRDAKLQGMGVFGW